MRKLILIVGCHRSGTSAVAGCLARLGVDLGNNLLPPGFDNPKGFFEHRGVMDMHEFMLQKYGTGWDEPWNLVEFNDPGFDDEIAAILHSMKSDVCAVKDPRTVLFFDSWKRVCRRLEIELTVIEVRRDREAVIDSLMTRWGWDRRATQKVVDYYLAEIADRRQEALEYGCAWHIVSFPDDIAADDFFDPALVHHGRRPVSVVVPSATDDNVCEFVESLISSHPSFEDHPERIVIVSDGLSRETRRHLKGVTWVKGKKPFIFARAINQGVRAAGTDDILICGDDVRFATNNLVDRLQTLSGGAAAISPKIIGRVGQPAQHLDSDAVTAEWLAFICVFITREAWNQVGELDERFTGYGCDDVDWCRRATALGLELQIDLGSRVVHAENGSFHVMPNQVNLWEQNNQILEAKWGYGA
jgi:hypothetical protein